MSSKERGAPDVEHDVFEQGPILPRGIPVGMGLLVVAVSLLAATSERGLDLQGFLVILAMAGALGLIVVLATMWEWRKTVRVDARGLHVKGQLALRPRQMGFVEVMRGGPAATWSWPLLRPRGRERPRLPARQNLYGGLYGLGPAVAVEDLSGDHPTIWLIPSRDPHRMAALLERVRDQAGGRVS
jgi:hypothetical protein